jgi:hypothetical protein
MDVVALLRNGTTAAAYSKICSKPFFIPTGNLCISEISVRLFSVVYVFRLFSRPHYFLVKCYYGLKSTLGCLWLF